MYDYERDPNRNEYVDLGYHYDPGIQAFICHLCYQLYRWRGPQGIMAARQHRRGCQGKR